MTNAGTLKLTTSGERELVMTRSFDAPRQLVFDAHTKPELVRRGARRGDKVHHGVGCGGRLRRARGAVGGAAGWGARMSGASTVPPAPPRRRWRSVGAVVAGFVAVFALSVGTDQVLHVLKVYPPWGEPMAGALFMLATAYRIVYTILGGYIKIGRAHV